MTADLIRDFETFRSEVEKALKLIQKNDLSALGESALCDLAVIRRQMDPYMAMNPLYRGEVLKRILEESVESLRPPDIKPKLDREEWRHYLIWTEVYFKRRRWRDVAYNVLGLADVRYYYYRTKALDRLTQTLMLAEQKIRQKLSITNIQLQNPPYTEFVDRLDGEGSDFVEEIVSILNESRIVALAGMGGVGKTVLAWEVAKRCIERGLFDAVIWTSAKREILISPTEIISIADYVDSLDSLLISIAKAFDHREVLTIPIEEHDERYNQVKRLLGEMPCLLIVDNLERLSKEDTKEISRFLRELPLPTRVLLTSRERIQGRGEWAIEVPGMRPEEAEIFIKNECRRLEWLPTSDEIEKIHALCEGNPLSMQMMLGLMKSHGYDLKQAFSSALTREGLLRFLFQNAYDNLTPNAKRVLEVMPIFAAPAWPGTIRGASDLERGYVDDALGTLYHAFLVRKDVLGRYDLPVTVQQYLEGITNKGALNQGQRSLAQYYCDYLRDKKLQARINFCKKDKQNIFAIMHWCYAQSEWELILCLTGVLSHPIGLLGYWSDRLVWGKRALEASEKIPDPHLYAWHSVFDVGYTHLLMEHSDLARQMFEEALAQAEYPDVVALASRNLGYMMLDSDREKALEFLQKSLDSWENWEDVSKPFWVGVTKKVLARLRLRLGQFVEAQELIENALEMFGTGFPDVEQEIKLIGDLALVFGKQRRFDKADALLKKAAQLAKDYDLDAGEAYTMTRQAEVEADKGNIQKAIVLAGDAYNKFKRLGAKYWMREPEAIIERLTEQLPPAELGKEQPEPGYEHAAGV